MDNDVIELSSKSGDGEGVNDMWSRNGNATKPKQTFENSKEDFGPSFTALESMKQMYQRRSIVLAILVFVVGAGIGATIAVIAFTQTKMEEIPKMDFARNTSASPTSHNNSPFRVYSSSVSANSTTASTSNPPTTTPTTTTTATTTTPTTTLPNTTTSTTTPTTTLTTTTQIRTSPTPTYNPVRCPMIYERKCYRAIKGRNELNRTQAQQLCEGIGWNLTNIYSTSHYFMIEGYLRSDFPTNGFISAWTGMTIVPAYSHLYLRNGDSITIPGIPWHDGFPSKTPTSIYVGVNVRRTPTDKIDEGLWNFKAYWNCTAAMCEQP